MSFIIFILFFFFIIAFFLVTFAMSFIRNVLSFFGFGRKKETHAGARSQGPNTNYGHNANAAKENDGKKVLFDKDEGEYVDFEEIKD